MFHTQPSAQQIQQMNSYQLEQYLNYKKVSYDTQIHTTQRQDFPNNYIPISKQLKPDITHYHPTQNYNHFQQDRSTSPYQNVRRDDLQQKVQQYQQKHFPKQVLPKYPTKPNFQTTKIDNIPLQRSVMNFSTNFDTKQHQRSKSQIMSQQISPIDTMELSAVIHNTQQQLNENQKKFDSPDQKNKNNIEIKQAHSIQESPKFNNSEKKQINIQIEIPEDNISATIEDTLNQFEKSLERNNKIDIDIDTFESNEINVVQERKISKQYSEEFKSQQLSQEFKKSSKQFSEEFKKSSKQNLEEFKKSSKQNSEEFKKSSKQYSEESIQQIQENQKSDNDYINQLLENSKNLRNKANELGDKHDLLLKNHKFLNEYNNFNQNDKGVENNLYEYNSNHKLTDINQKFDTMDSNYSFQKKNVQSQEKVTISEYDIQEQIYNSNDNKFKKNYDQKFEQTKDKIENQQIQEKNDELQNLQQNPTIDNINDQLYQTQTTEKQSLQNKSDNDTLKILIHTEDTIQNKSTKRKDSFDPLLNLYNEKEQEIDQNMETLQQNYNQQKEEKVKKQKNIWEKADRIQKQFDQALNKEEQPQKDKNDIDDIINQFRQESKQEDFQNQCEKISLKDSEQNTDTYYDQQSIPNSLQNMNKNQQINEQIKIYQKEQKNLINQNPNTNLNQNFQQQLQNNFEEFQQLIQNQFSDKIQENNSYMEKTAENPLLNDNKDYQMQDTIQSDYTNTGKTHKINKETHPLKDFKYVGETINSRDGGEFQQFQELNKIMLKIQSIKNELNFDFLELIEKTYDQIQDQNILSSRESNIKIQEQLMKLSQNIDNQMNNPQVLQQSLNNEDRKEHIKLARVSHRDSVPKCMNHSKTSQNIYYSPSTQKEEKSNVFDSPPYKEKRILFTPFQRQQVKTLNINKGYQLTQTLAQNNDCTSYKLHNGNDKQILLSTDIKYQNNTSVVSHQHN